MKNNENESGFSKLQTILLEMSREGNFPVSVLIDEQGLTITFSADGNMDPSSLSAVVALVKKVAFQATRQIGMAKITEISLYDVNFQRLVCRPFNVGNQELILAIMVPGKSYRRLTNLAISKIQSVWSRYWS